MPLLNTPIIFAVMLPYALITLSGIVALDTSEYGILEYSQVALLLLASWQWGILACRRTHAEANPVHPLIACLCCAITLVAVGREASWGRVYGLPPHYYVPIKVTLAVLFISTVLIVSYRWAAFTQHRRAHIRRFFRSSAGACIGCCIALVLIGDFFDKKFFVWEHNELVEEICESSAYIMLLLAPLRQLHNRVLTMQLRYPPPCPQQ